MVVVYCPKCGSYEIKKINQAAFKCSECENTFLFDTAKYEEVNYGGISLPDVQIN